jgi:hypothetical protein
MAKLLSGTRIYGVANVDTQIYVGSNVSISTSAVTIGNTAAVYSTVNATNFTGTSNNSTYVGGLLPTAFVNTSSTFANSASQDVAIGGTYNALTATLATTGVVAGAYGNTTSVPTITIDAKGRITSVSNNTITSPINTVNTTGNFTIAGNLVFTSANVYFANGLVANNSTSIKFKTLNGNNVYFTQQNDDNFVFYTTDATGSPRPVWSVFANTATSNLSVSIPMTFAANVNLLGTSYIALNTLVLSNTAGSLDLNTNGITDYTSAPVAKTVSFTVANTESGSIYQCTNATVATVITLPASAVTGFNATILQTGAANVIFWAAGGTLNKRTGVGANTSTANIGGQYGMATIIRLSTGNWVIGGDVY